MATLAPFMVHQYFDNNSIKLSGGKLNFYYSGTTTRKDTYSSVGATLSNPVVLDSNGRKTGGIWLGDGDYKLVLTDSNDDIITTVDLIGAVGSPEYWTQVDTRIYYNTGKVAIGTADAQTEDLYVSGITRLVGTLRIIDTITLGDDLDITGNITSVTNVTTTGNVSSISDTKTGRYSGGEGAVDATAARAAEVSISTKNVVIIAPTTTSTDYYAFSSKTDGQTVHFYNNGSVSARIDNDESGGLYLSPKQGGTHVWDETLDRWLDV